MGVAVVGEVWPQSMGVAAAAASLSKRVWPPIDGRGNWQFFASSSEGRI